MIPVTHMKGRNVALFGLGGSGLATAEALTMGGANVLAFDDNPSSVEKAHAAGIQTGDLREADWSRMDALVLAPGVPLTHPKPHWSVELAKRAGVEVIGDVELFMRERRAVCPDAKVIAITGTNGKSTTTALVSHVLAENGYDVQMGGNIGKAVLTLEPFEPFRREGGRVYVIEVSSYQIDLAPTIDPDVGVLLNLAPDHLDRHGTFARYAAIKERLVAGARRAVVGIDDDASAAIATRVRANAVSIRHDTGDISFDRYPGGRGALMRDGRVLAEMADFPALAGPHNAQNALVALAATKGFVRTGAVIRAFRTFPGLAHRLERIGSVGNVLFVNDSKGTNPDAAATALQSYKKVRWIAGGLPKPGGIEDLRPYFDRVTKAYLIGDAAPDFAATIGETVPYEISGTVKDAVNHAAADALGNGGGVVLLSPAAASFDQFRNFEERGRAFREAVEQLEGFSPA